MPCPHYRRPDERGVTALEVQLPRINAGLQTALRQNNLVLESEIGALTDLIGAKATDTTAATGQTADIAALTAIVAGLLLRVTALGG